MVKENKSKLLYFFLNTIYVDFVVEVWCSLHRLCDQEQCYSIAANVNDICNEYIQISIPLQCK